MPLLSWVIEWSPFWQFCSLSLAFLTFLSLAPVNQPSGLLHFSFFVSFWPQNEKQKMKPTRGRSRGSTQNRQDSFKLRFPWIDAHDHFIGRLASTETSTVCSPLVAKYLTLFQAFWPLIFKIFVTVYVYTIYILQSLNFQFSLKKVAEKFSDWKIYENFHEY